MLLQARKWATNEEFEHLLDNYTLVIQNQARMKVAREYDEYLLKECTKEYARGMHDGKEIFDKIFNS